MEITADQYYARLLHEWRNSLTMIDTPSIREGENLSMKFGYLFQDGTIAYSSMRGEMKFSLIDQYAQAIPFLDFMGMKLKYHYERSDSYVVMSYGDAISKKNELESMEFIKELKRMHAELQDYIRENHNNDLKEGMMVYSDGEILDHADNQISFPCFSPETFFFPLEMTGNTGIRYSYAIIPISCRYDVVTKIRRIHHYIRPVKKEYDEMASEYA